MFYNIIITPLEIVFGWIFNIVHNCVPSVGIIGCIIGVSLCMNLLALPLYNVADRISARERNIARGLKHWTEHIKRTFKGDERFMMLSEYYRQNNYHPILRLRSTLSILIQIPFFIAAYHYLRNNDLLFGASFWIFKDLGRPDALIPLAFGNTVFSLNVLPILMAMINCISGTLYAKGAPLREKIQIYILATVFLVLLYNSPSGLVIYWIFNNMFSLVKNILKRVENKTLVLYFGICIILLLFVHYISRNRFGYKKRLMLLGIYALFALPAVCRYFGISRFSEKLKNIYNFITKRLMPSNFCTSKISVLWIAVISGIGLDILCGFVLPASIIASSPVEFSFLGDTPSPFSYIYRCCTIFTGIFVFWPLVFYKMYGMKIKFFISIIMFSLFICAVFNVYVFKFQCNSIDTTFNMGSSSIFTVSKPLFFLIPFEILLFSLLGSAYVLKHGGFRFLSWCVISICMGMIGLGCMKSFKIYKQYIGYAENIKQHKNMVVGKNTDVVPIFHLTKEKKNVLILFLDRGIGPFVERIFTDFPTLKEKFKGFTYFPNTVSFYESTLFGAPPLYGGYEYTPEELNKRDEELFVDKHNESLLVAPKLFADAGFSVMITDPAYPNYSEKGDFSAFAPYSKINVTETGGNTYYRFIQEKGINYDDADEICSNQIINFSILQILLPCTRKFFYKNCRLSQRIKNSKKWIEPFSTLYYLPELTDFISQDGSFISIRSMVAHNVFGEIGDDYESISDDSEWWDNRTELLYRANVAALRQFGKYLDWLRENSVYDNTRIIIVSDHGYPVETEKYQSFDKDAFFASWHSCMLLYKDFDSNDGIKIDETFMTNADTIFLATDRLDCSDINPFTGKKLSVSKNDGVNIYMSRDISKDWNPDFVRESCRYDFDEINGWHVLPGNIYDANNWIPLSEWNKIHGGTQ